MQEPSRYWNAAILAAGGLLVGSVWAADAPGRPACATVDLLAAWRAGVVTLEQPGWQVGESAAPPRVLTTADGLFTLHYGSLGVDVRSGLRGGGRRAVPAAVLRVEAVLATVRQVLVDQAGWQPPDPARPLDVYLVTGADAGSSRVVPQIEPTMLSEEGVPASMVLSGPPGSWAAQAVHQYLHVLQLRQSAREETWMYEASALALEARWSGQEPPAGAAEALTTLPPGRSLLSGDEQGFATAALFLGYLAEVHGDGVLVEMWRQAGRRYGPDSLGALDIALRLTDLTTLEEAWREFTIWLAYPDAASRPMLTGRLAESVPPAPAARQVNALPDGGLGDEPLEVQPFGAVFIHLDGLHDAGAIRLELEISPDAAVSADVLVSWKHVPLGWMVVPVTVDAGRGVINVPLAPGSRAVLIVRSNEPLGGPPASVRFAASAEPTYPFDLAFLAADSSPGRVDVSWGTETESRMYGWLIYRATEPQGIFRPLTRLPIPSMGESDAPLAYQFTDTNVVAGSRYYYLVEGITFDGLARRSAAVTTRAAPLR